MHHKIFFLRRIKWKLIYVTEANAFHSVTQWNTELCTSMHRCVKTVLSSISFLKHCRIMIRYHFISYEIWDFHGSENMDCGLLGCTDRGDVFLHNVGNHLQHYRASQSTIFRKLEPNTVYEHSYCCMPSILLAYPYFCFHILWGSVKIQRAFIFKHYISL
jgi:hypothetical protein